MLVEINHADKNKSIYKCDMCNKRINVESKIAICTSKQNENAKKRWDLCEHCYRILDKSIEKRRTKDG